jgi:hypothetical protein
MTPAMPQLLRNRLYDIFLRGAVDNETHVVSLNIVELEQVVKVRDAAVGALYAIWNNPERARSQASEALDKIRQLETYLQPKA